MNTNALNIKPNEPGPYSLVITNGRVIDPETGLDATRHVGIKGGPHRRHFRNPAARDKDRGRNGTRRRARFHRPPRPWPGVAGRPDESL